MMKNLQRCLAVLMLGGLVSCSAPVAYDWAAPYRGSLAAEYTLYQVDEQLLPTLADDVHPVYLMYVGRHGARYMDGHHSYSHLLALMLEADSLGVLTPRGQEFLAWYRDFVPQVAGQEGKLTGVGRQQLADIGRSLYAWQPDLMQQVRVSTSPSQRVIDSEESLVGAVPTLQFDKVDTTSLLAVTNGWDIPAEASAAYDSISNVLFDATSFAQTWVTDLSLIRKYYWHAGEFARIMRNLVADFPCLDFAVDSPQAWLTDAELKGALDANNLVYYCLLCRCPLTHQFGLSSYRPTWQFLVRAAQEDMAAGRTAHLAFSHDIILHGLNALLGMETYATEVEDLTHVSDYVTSSHMPMAANLSLLVCRKEGVADLWVYAFFNGRPVHLDFEEVAPYAYRWADLAKLADSLE